MKRRNREATLVERLSWLRVQIAAIRKRIRGGPQKKKREKLERLLEQGLILRKKLHAELRRVRRRQNAKLVNQLAELLRPHRKAFLERVKKFDKRQMKLRATLAKLGRPIPRPEQKRAVA